MPPDTILPITQPKLSSGATDLHALDIGVGAVASLAELKVVDAQQENMLIDALLRRDANAMVLAKHYAEKHSRKFVEHLLRSMTPGAILPSSAPTKQKIKPVTVVIGGGLAGLSVALKLLDQGLKVYLLDKEAFLGGNSAYASSGINGVDPKANTGDSVDSFTQDMLKGAKMKEGDPYATHLRVMAKWSGEGLEFLRQRVGLKLDIVGQLGGHSFPRTWRPPEGMAGNEIIFALARKVKEYKDRPDLFDLMLGCEVTSLITNEAGAVEGVEYKVVKTGVVGKINADNVVIATGGYANGHGTDSVLSRFRPELVALATTNGRWATGDGIKMAEKVGGKLVDMQEVQVHPTGFIDPKKPTATTKTLCAEILRGVGGIILNRTGHRFVDELQTRDHVSNTMKSNDPDRLEFAIIINEAGAKIADKHLSFYQKKGLLNKYSTVTELAAWLGADVNTVTQTLTDYNRYASEGKDPFGKKFFHNTPFSTDGHFYAGLITPVTHYTMGGLGIDTKGRVVTEGDTVIPGLYAAGEVIGGLHGQNRLGGNGLSEAVVFGLIVADDILSTVPPNQDPNIPQATEEKAAAVTKWEDRKITKAEIAHHNSEKTCWVILHGKVYDFTTFLEEHPAGPEAILEIAGSDGTKIFNDIHNIAMLDDFTPIGVLV